MAVTQRLRTTCSLTGHGLCPAVLCKAGREHILALPETLGYVPRSAGDMGIIRQTLRLRYNGTTLGAQCLGLETYGVASSKASRIHGMPKGSDPLPCCQSSRVAPIGVGLQASGIRAAQIRVSEVYYDSIGKDFRVVCRI